MGMLSRAMKKRKEEMQATLEDTSTVTPIETTISLDPELAQRLHDIAVLRGTTVDRLVHSRMVALVNAFERGKILTLQDTMQYGQYKGLLVEEMIRADPRYTGWLASVSEIFVLDEEATELLRELS